MTRLQELKWYAKQARKAGLNVNGGKNGGGWIRLAAAIGTRAESKNAGRFALRAKFGSPQFPKPTSQTHAEPVKVGNRKQRHRDYAATDAFLESFEWRRVRMMALKRDGASCACCGATRADGLRMHVDHIKPRKLFPELALDLKNLQVLCEVCNHGKGNWDQTDWRPQPVANDLQPEGAAHLRSITTEGK